jgi:hypothetical protein
MIVSAQGPSEALLVLVGITATRRSRTSLSSFFAGHGAYQTFVPRLPLRRGLRPSARWLERYLARTVRTQERGPLHVLAYIAGGAVLRCLAESARLPDLARVLYVRGPVQELVPAAMVRRYGRLLARLLGGRSMIDLADGWPAALPLPRVLGEQGLLIEQGVSSLARSLGLGPESVAAASWDPERLLPGAHAVLRVPESHDEVYTSQRLLAAALDFFRSGRFGGAPP